MQFAEGALTAPLTWRHCLRGGRRQAAEALLDQPAALSKQEGHPLRVAAASAGCRYLRAMSSIVPEVLPQTYSRARNRTGADTARAVNAQLQTCAEEEHHCALPLPVWVQNVWSDVSPQTQKRMGSCSELQGSSPVGARTKEGAATWPGRAPPLPVRSQSQQAVHHALKAQRPCSVAT